MPIFKFWKMHGAGNDFVLILDLRRRFPTKKAGIIQNLCHRPDGIGSEGLILLQPAPTAIRQQHTDAVCMRFFNPDGGEAAMCGNGARCAARLAVDSQLVPGRTVRLITSAGAVTAKVQPGGNVQLALPPPSNIKPDLHIRAGQRNWRVHFINTGVPHAVIFVKNIRGLDVRRAGAAVRYHAMFAPAGTNVDFVERAGHHTLRVRTYERGVEDETGACGTGIAAAAVMAGLLGVMSPPVNVICAHGDKLCVNYRLEDGRVEEFTLAGPTKYVFDGHIRLPSKAT